MELTVLAYVFFVTFFSGFLQTLTGFGYALSAAPLLTLVMSPKEVVMYILLTGLLIKGALVYQTRGQGQFRQILPIFLASIAGALPGAWVMTVISDGVLKIAIGLVLLAATAAIYHNLTIPKDRPFLARTLVGLSSGFLASTTSLNGPPIVLYYMGENADKHLIRANLARYFLLGNTASLVMSFYFGTLQVVSLFTYVVLSVPALGLGLWIGEIVFRKVDANMFRRIALVVISVSGTICIVMGLWSTFRFR